MVPEGQECMVERYGNKNRKLRAHILSHKHNAEKQNASSMRLFIPKPTPSNIHPLARLCHLNLPNSHQLRTTCSNVQDTFFYTLKLNTTALKDVFLNFGSFLTLSSNNQEFRKVQSAKSHQKTSFP